MFEFGYYLYKTLDPKYYNLQGNRYSLELYREIKTDQLCIQNIISTYLLEKKGPQLLYLSPI